MSMLGPVTMHICEFL